MPYLQKWVDATSAKLMMHRKTWYIHRSDTFIALSHAYHPAFDDAAEYLIVLLQASGQLLLELHIIKSLN